MKRTCRRIQRTLAEQGPSALQSDAPAQQHLEECDDCFSVLEALTELDETFLEMPRLDAPDELVERLLARSELTDPRESPSAGIPAASPSPWTRLLAGIARPRRPVWIAGGALAAVALAAVVITIFQPFPSAPEPQLGQIVPGETESLTRTSRFKASGDQGIDSEPVIEANASYYSEDVEGGEIEREPSGPVGGYLEDLPQDELPIWVGRESDISFRGGSPGIEANEGPFAKDEAARKDVRERLRERLRTLPRGRQGAEAEDRRSNEDDRSGLVADDLVFGIPDASKTDGPIHVGGDVRKPEKVFAPAPRYTEIARKARVQGVVIVQAIIDEQGDVTDVKVLKALPMGLDEAAVETVRTWKFKPATLNGKPVEVYYNLTVNFRLDGGRAGETSALPARPLGATPASPFEPGELARRFLDERTATEVPFQTAGGYWRNTYVPGDPVLRYLQARLLERDRAPLEALAGSSLLLHDAAQRPSQPFDPPARSALAVFLHADRRAVDGETRLLLQVGLQGTERYGGRRPAMNVSLVLDLDDEVPVESAAALRAVVTAFGQAREPGDRFRLIVAGRPTGSAGNITVAPEDFRRGPLTVAMQRLLDPEQRPKEGKVIDLATALESAIAAALQSDDPETPLGSSLVVVATARSLGAAVRPLAGLAHRSAVGGVPVSVVGVGERVDLGELDTVALAGQGNRRLLLAAAESTGVVDRELSAAARAIARAVRLRIRLAPGVRLVDVVGSERLDARRAQQTREAERSIDRRIAENLGIEADRGDDEAGIQIVLPSFYAGDSHVVLLDVVVPGPGAVADVRVRYKDLVHLGNGVASDRLSLERGDAAPGPLERNVLKNLLALRARDVLERAGTSVAAGDAAAALDRLRKLRGLLVGLGSELPDLHNDRDLQRDVAMLEEYTRLLGREIDGGSVQLAYLADSLRYAGRLKVLPRPQSIGGKR